MITITEKNNKIYILQDSGENEKSSGSGILLYFFLTLIGRLVLLENPDSIFFIYCFISLFLIYLILVNSILRKKTEIILDLNERNLIMKKETFNFKNIIKVDVKGICYRASVASYGVEIYYDRKQKLILRSCLENEAKEIVKTLKMFIKGEEDEKIYNKFFRR
ncbi:hypothetical protein [Fusobacterium hwasookii]|uniref:Sucrose-6-phosphate hydrolase n=1 Tax=Fusobacterium hwasookii ChDC F128 TaxID=1216362 RepID=A0ABP2R443_9FUSO|nr:hypothetical protein [Fusobacterium hwasookii]EJU07482.1 hypothetical protein B437_07397 [Fusobacterium hwasookii ChDC F128]QNE65749.1 hypothetical protein H5V36_07770 [Fusobacterium hwasookii]